MTKLTNTLFAGAYLLCSALSASALTSPLTADETITNDETLSGEKFTINSGAVLKIEGYAVFQKTASGDNVDITVGSDSQDRRIDLSTADAVNLGTLTLQKSSVFGFILGERVVSLEKLNADTTAECLTLENFPNDIFQIKDSSNLSIVDGATLRVENGTSHTDIALIRDTALEAGQYWTITSEGFLNVVPKSAEYAAIFWGDCDCFCIEAQGYNLDGTEENITKRLGV